MVFVTYILIVMYIVLLVIASIKQLKEEGFQLRTGMFVIVSISILVILVLPNKDWVFLLLILEFILLHILAIVQGLLKFGRINYHHHIMRFFFHCIIMILVYLFIK